MVSEFRHTTVQDLHYRWSQLILKIICAQKRICFQVSCLVKIENKLEHTIAVPYTFTSTSDISLSVLKSDNKVRTDFNINQFQLGDVLTLFYNLTDEFLDKRFENTLEKCFVISAGGIVPLMGVETHYGCPDWGSDYLTVRANFCRL